MAEQWINKQTIITRTKRSHDCPSPNPSIPFHIYQTWHSKTLPPNMYKCVETLKKQNPEFKHFLFDDGDCRDFIKGHFGKSILNAYDHLYPGQYRADLWRYCILYIYGGVYIDIKYKCSNGFKLCEIMDKERFVVERPGYWAENRWGVYNGLMVCKPRNKLMLACIKRVVENVRTKYMGFSELYPTGPGLIGELYFKDIRKTENLDKLKDLELYFNPKKDDQIIYKHSLVLEAYAGYRKEQSKTQVRPHYSKLWEEEKVYV